MDHETTNPHLRTTKVLYRCSCGSDLRVDPDVGGSCLECGQLVTPKMLHHDLALTMTIQGGQQIDLDQTRVDSKSSDGDADLLVGQTLGHFEIINPLGRGGMGQVYRALDTSLQRYVAVKVLKSGLGTTEITTSDEQEIDSLLQEAVAQARVTHPNIATIYYVGKQQGAPFLAMELIDGITLSQRIESTPMSFYEICQIGIQVAEALKFSFELDIIHGDIKPSNILIHANGNAKLSDFGMSRQISKDKSEAIGGTPNYLAPELLQGGTPSIQSDMYALGVTLYEMTFGRLPIKLSGVSIADWIDSHRANEIKFPKPWPPHLPDGWREFLERLLESDPNNRYASYENLLSELKQLQPAPTKPARRVPRLIAAGIDILVVLLLSLPMQILTQIPAVENYFQQHPLLNFEVQLFYLLPIIGYLSMVFLWRHSPGRELLHIRVINRFGLTPAPRLMLGREIARISLAWVITFALFVDPLDIFLIDVLFLGINAALILFTLVNVGFLIVYKQGKCLHDLFFKTSVVLG